MTRKLFSMMLCAFALLLLMGAGTVPAQTAAIAAEEESAAQHRAFALETEPQSVNKASSKAVHAAVGASPLALAENTEGNLLIDGVRAPAEVMLSNRSGVSYVALAGMAKALDESASVSWDSASVWPPSPPQS